MHRLRELTKMKKIQEHNEFLGQKDDLYDDAFRKSSEVGNDIDKSLYNVSNSQKTQRDGPFGLFYRKKQPLKLSDKMNI